MRSKSIPPHPGRKNPNGAGSVFWSPSRECWLATYTRGLDPTGKPITKRFRAPTEGEARARRDADRARWEALRVLGISGEVKVPRVPLGLPKGREFVRLNDPVFRRWIYKRDHGLCSLCRQPLDFAEMHVDHIRPRIEGGNDAVTNLRISHPACNLDRRHQRARKVTR